MQQPVAEHLVAAGLDYESLFVPALFAPWTHHLLVGAKVKPGDHVLDIACGTGVLTRDVLAAVGHAGAAVGVDPAPGMLAVAQQKVPAGEWVLAPAESLPLTDGQFDSVVSQFGMMFFEDRQQATHEMYRVLKPGGRIALATWRAVAFNPAYADVIHILHEQVSHAAAQVLRMPFSLEDAGEIEAALTSSGFAQIEVRAETETARFPSVREMVEAELRGWLPLFDIVLDEPAISRILAAAETALARYQTPSGQAQFPTSAHIVTAVKPLNG